MVKLACFSQKKKYAIYQGEDDYKMQEHAMCHLIPIGRPLVKIWAASGIVKNFKYKRTMDLGNICIRQNILEITGISSSKLCSSLINDF